MKVQDQNKSNCFFSLHGIILEEKPTSLEPKKSLKKVHGLENQSIN
jgi:hypothetical protein